MVMKMITDAIKILRSPLTPTSYKDSSINLKRGDNTDDQKDDILRGKTIQPSIPPLWVVPISYVVLKLGCNLRVTSRPVATTYCLAVAADEP